MSGGHGAVFETSTGRWRLAANLTGMANCYEGVQATYGRCRSTPYEGYRTDFKQSTRYCEALVKQEDS